MLAQRKLTKRKCAPADGRCAIAFWVLPQGAMVLGFALKAELLCFARTKQTNEKKMRPGGWSLRDFPRHSLLCVTAQHGPSGAGLHWNGHPCPFLPVAPPSSASLRGGEEQEQSMGKSKGKSRARARARAGQSKSKGRRSVDGGYGLLGGERFFWLTVRVG